MNKKVLYFGSGAHFSTRHGQLMVALKDTGEERSFDPEDVLLLELDSPQITISQGAMQVLLQNKVAVTVCDSRHLPAGMLLPMEGHTLHQRHVRAQAAAPDKLRAKLWQGLVQAKLRNQAAVLDCYGHEMERLLYLAKHTDTGDTQNHEAQGAVYYWPLVFGGRLGHTGFRRDTDANPGSDQGPNLLLNYGYAVLRAIVARALTGAGLYPALGVHHQNQYNAYALADDVMEPLRPMVDLLVCLRLEQGSAPEALTKNEKAAMLNLATYDVRLGNEHVSVGEAARRIAATLAHCYLGERKPETWQLPAMVFAKNKVAIPPSARKNRVQKAEESPE